MSSMEKILELHTEQDARNFEELKVELKELRAEVQGLRGEMGRYKGFVGGLVFAMSALAAVISLAIGWFR